MIRRAVLVTISLALGIPALAHAGRPTAAQAKAAATAWTKAMEKVGGENPDFTALLALTADPMRVLVFGQSGDAHCDFTVTDRAKLPEALKCIGEGGAPLKPLKAFTKKDLKKLWDPLRDHADEIAALDKTSVVFVHYEEGESESTIAFIVVSLGADKKARVSAVFTAIVIS